MAVDHYENFPVASWLCPAAMRPAVRAIYAFARTADDLADEGDAGAQDRLAALALYRAELLRVAGGAAATRWVHVFAPLQQSLVRHDLPLVHLEALLDAFVQDVRNPPYPDRAALLDYCSRSANPVGRLVLHLHGVADAASLHQSDAICSALQLANFWQDLSVDLPRGRMYVPLSDALRHGVSADALAQRRDSPEARALVRDLCGWTRELMTAGAPLVHRLPGRAGLELRFVVQGGLRILEKIEAMDHDALRRRPTLGWTDTLPMGWSACRMSAAPAHAGRAA
jgi:squalene synthase HpnC